MVQHTSLSIWIDVAKSVLEEAGYNPETILKAADIKLDDLPEQLDRSSVEAIADAWRLMVEKTGNPAVGIAAAERYFQPASWRAVGLSVLCSNNLRDAMQRLVRYGELITDVAQFEIEEQGDCTALLVLPRLDAFTIGYEAVDFGIASIVKLFRMSYPGGVDPVLIEYQRSEVTETEPYTTYYHCDIKFNSDRLAIVYRNEDLDKPLPMASNELANYQDRMSADYIARFGNNSIVIKVRDEIVRLLPGGEVSPQQIADNLNLSLRNLQRKLGDENTNFKELLSEIRQQLAQEYIQQSYRSFNEIAYLLGFSDHSNFTRAFKRWFNKSPTQYRADLEQPQGCAS